MHIKTDETDKPTPKTLHRFLEAKLPNKSCCIDLTGDPAWVEYVGDLLRHAIEREVVVVKGKK